MQQLAIQAAPLDNLRVLLTPGQVKPLIVGAARARALLADRVVWNVNATAHGGGVAEMLQGLLAYGLGAGVDTRWLVLDGDPAFFALTKRVHNALHGSEHGPDFDAAEHRHYEQVLDANLSSLTSLVRAGDVVLLHDPQTAGLADALREIGAYVIWRCHIGSDSSNANTDGGWEFLRGYLEQAEAFVFSRQDYVPDWVAPDRVRVIAPSIDPFSAKNRDLDDVEVGRVLRRAGLITGDDGDEVIPFARRDGTAGLVRRHRDLLSGSAPPPAGAPLVVQVSRWDRLKDMPGVLSAFADYIAPTSPDAHLMLVGPDVAGVSDDPEGGAVLAECRAAWTHLPDPIRMRCHLACIPMDDIDENATIINALQRHATVVVQKSIAEGFGLTVTEAMWKGRAVLASAVGGIQDQISDGIEGLLLPDPHDLPGFAKRLNLILDDPSLGKRLGASAHERVRAHFLDDRHLLQYVDLFGELIGRSPGAAEGNLGPTTSDWPDQ